MARAQPASPALVALPHPPPATLLLLGVSGTPVLRARVSLLCPQVPSPATWRPASRHVRMLCARPPRPAGGLPPGRPGGHWKPALPRGGVDTCFLCSTPLPVLFLDPFSEPLAACEAAHGQRAQPPTRASGLPVAGLGSHFLRSAQFPRVPLLFRFQVFGVSSSVRLREFRFRALLKRSLSFQYRTGKRKK